MHTYSYYTFDPLLVYCGSELLSVPSNERLLLKPTQYGAPSVSWVLTYRGGEQFNITQNDEHVHMYIAMYIYMYTVHEHAVCIYMCIGIIQG